MDVTMSPSPQPPPEAVQTFHLFPRLPAELRHQIFTFALPDPVIVLYPEWQRNWRTYPEQPMAPMSYTFEPPGRVVTLIPIALPLVAVNHEARAIARRWAEREGFKAGRPHAIPPDLEEIPPWLPPVAVEAGPYTYWRPCCPERDALYVHSKYGERLHCSQTFYQRSRKERTEGLGCAPGQFSRFRWGRGLCRPWELQWLAIVEMSFRKVLRRVDSTGSFMSLYLEEGDDRWSVKLQGLFVVWGADAGATPPSKTSWSWKRFERTEGGSVVWKRDGPGAGAFVLKSGTEAEAEPRTLGLLARVNTLLAPKFRRPGSDVQAFEVCLVRVVGYGV
ncbi:hypothetical protein QBC39DRAFT_416412 [Podospora conica]|nr:hypothetical protein QBC39DRAFT_416412 [Schizothecium conicum]